MAELARTSSGTIGRCVQRDVNEVDVSAHDVEDVIAVKCDRRDEAGDAHCHECVREDVPDLAHDVFPSFGGSFRWSFSS
jgi:hypothetical protein